jgi:hypothetical protein
MTDSTGRQRFSKSAGALLLCLLGALVTATSAAALPDGRGWEMVSPPDKNGGQVDLPGQAAGGGLLQAAAQGSAVTFSSRASFAGGQGAPPASQYIATRSGAGWSTQNITVPIFSGSYDFTEGGVPYQLFSPDLARGLLLNGDHCRGEAQGCAVANPPLGGTDAPEGYQDYYLREGGSFEALVGSADVAGHGLDPASFDLRFEGASPDLQTIVLSSCAALTASASDGCATNAQNLYLWSKATGSLSLINTTPGVALAAQAGAVSNDGSRVYFEGIEDGPLQLREGGTTYPVSAGAAAFQAASSDGTIAFYLEAGHLYRYATATHTATDITPSGGVAGVLGASSDGSRVYFQDATGLESWSAGSTTVAAGAEAADPSTYPPTTGAARVSADGTKLLFLSKAQLTGYDNTDKITGLPDSEVFLFDATTTTLRCLSCNPIASKRPSGPSSIPGAVANGGAPGSTDSYKPRALSANGKRVFFDSGDSLVSSDSNADPTSHAGVRDVYQWEAFGEGSCAKASGCVEILSNGALPEGASFADASADGADAYFLTASSLVGADFGSVDLYDARIGGGFPEPPPTIPCNGDACQILPPRPSDLTLTTTLAGAGNPAVTYHKYCRRGYVKRKGLCVKRGAHKRRHHKNKAHKKGRVR